MTFRFVTLKEIYDFFKNLLKSQRNIIEEFPYYINADRHLETLSNPCSLRNPLSILNKICGMPRNIVVAIRVDVMHRGRGCGISMANGEASVEVTSP